jgi:hypothetical protein
MHALYGGLYLVAARSTAARLPKLKPAQARRLSETLGSVPLRNANDGIVPTQSQVWGEVIDGVEADHLDLIGHYGEWTGDASSADWLPSGSRFDRSSFERTWRNIASFIASETKVHGPPSSNR